MSRQTSRKWEGGIFFFMIISTTYALWGWAAIVAPNQPNK
jgi:hypothetical protein